LKQEFTVMGCDDCPMCSYLDNISYVCNHPFSGELILFIDTNEEGDPVTPKECPLLKSPIILRTKSWQTFENYWCKEN